MGFLLKRAAMVGVAAMLIGTLDPRPLTRGDAAAVAVEPPDDNRAPERPRLTVQIPAINKSGKTIRVPAGGSLQGALDKAEGGDLILLEPRATYEGPFQLRHKPGTGWITIASAAADLPKPGQRADPSHARLMPRLISSSGTVFQTDPGAHHYRLVGLEIAPADGQRLNTLVQFGDEERAVDALPHHLIVDRCYIHGDPKVGSRRGVALNARHAAVIDSYLADFKETGVDTQAIAAWNGTGPFRIANNYLEAAGENIMFGGADPAIPDLVPSDIEIVRNHLSKPLRWKSGHETFEGVEWTVKNLLELKNAQRVLIEGNVLEHNWPQAQNGFAILFTVRNQDGNAPWSTVADVIFANNLVRHVAAGINILGRDDNHPSRQTRRIAIRNNVFHDVGGPWGNGRLFQMLDGTSGVAIEHNTAFHTGSILAGGDNEPHTRFVFQNNIVQHNEHGITGSGTDIGTPSLEKYFPGAIVRGNVIVGGNAARYPKGNVFPGTAAAIGRSAATSGANVQILEKAVGQRIGNWELANGS